MTVLHTDRLVLTRLSYDDCDFVHELVNEPAFRRFIGDKKVRTLADARKYLQNGPIGSYEKHGFGMFLVSTKESLVPVGMCGLVQRDEFENPDIGFAFLRRFWAQGYALESARAVLEYAVKELQLLRIIAIVDEKNSASVRLIEKLGFGYERTVRMQGDEFDIRLYEMAID